MMRRISAGPLAAAVIACFVTACFSVSIDVRAQTSADRLPSVTGVIAIENARIVQAPGRILEMGTIIVRDGLIEAVGRDLRVPFDARRVTGDSLVVYAGFIDGLSHTGIPRPSDQGNSERVERPGEPAPERAGIQPQRLAAQMLTEDDASIEALRALGFTAAHVVPHGQSLPGKGSLVLLSGAPAAEVVLEREVSLFAQFQKPRGVYPATDMATLANLRQLFRESRRQHDLSALYAANPEGLARPPHSEVHRAFFPVVAGTQPVVFHTEGDASALQVHRVLELQRTLGFPLILSGVSQGFEVVDAVRQAGHPVLLTLTLPETPDTTKENGTDADTTKAMTPEAPSSHFISDHRTFTHVDVDAEADNLRARQSLERERYYATAAEFHRSGVLFGFTTKDAQPKDVHGNLRRMIDAGLPQDAALAALTTNVAEILGVSNRLGTIEPGKIANLVLTTGPLFGEGMTIRSVMVDGQLYEVTSGSEAADSTNGHEDADPVGTWSHEIATGSGATTAGTLVISRSGDRLTGSMTVDALPGRHALQSITVDGSSVRFSVSSPQLGTVDARMTMRGNTMTGTLDVPTMGTSNISATRTSSIPRK
jgi:imidazolonepropionase-like amidohydrolase